MNRLGQLAVSLLLLPAWSACTPTPAASPSQSESSASTPAETRTTETVPHEPAKADEAVDSSSKYEALVNAPDRSEEDRALDPGRKPVELLSFFSVEPGMQVAELAAGRGYTSELLARAVGPTGRVYGQNNRFILERFAEQPWSARLKTPIMSNVERIDSELEAPLPGHVDDLDAVFLVLFYHDTVWFQTDRARMNRAVYAALKPGGYYAIVDHAAETGAGTSVAKSLHRIEESTLISEVEAAGFVLEKTGDFLRNSEDARDWNASPSQAGERRGTSDRFVLLFRKPRSDSSSESAPSDGALHEVKQVTCTEPRSKRCTKDYRPVCATVDTGVRCIKAPCPGSELRTFSNACMACAEPKTLGYRNGVCAKANQHDEATD
jgi:predicted methyltransferase